jgi:membrane-associated phospholipid phosphatase
MDPYSNDPRPETEVSAPAADVGPVRALMEALASYPLGRVAIAGMVIVSVLFVYAFTNSAMQPRVDFYTVLDATVPFMPWTIIVYLSMYLLFGVASWYVDAIEFLRGLSALLVVSLISLLGFVAFPAHYPRPDPSIIESPWLQHMYISMFGFDLPGNTFPSLHVGTTVTAALMLKDTKTWWIWAIWAGAISLSTLTVKQHFVADVVGGITLAVFAHYWVRRVL